MTLSGQRPFELLRHLSEIHLWAASHVAGTAVRAGVSQLEDLEAPWPDLAVFRPEDDEHIEHYPATNANLVGHLQSAPADLDTWTFLSASSPRQMWAPRQAHETSIHRFDAESAIGAVVPFDSAVASDGIDKILTAIAPRAGELPLESSVTLADHPTDVEERRTVTLRPDGSTPYAAHNRLTPIGPALPGRGHARAIHWSCWVDRVSVQRLTPSHDPPADRW